ncbi:hypothetical protein SAMN05444166_5672 [Singulisphaera sp. GP187]|uniref:hypothetical protein n=1 Tax=Singulisphaera sp. GP187 TaxID=1882752 RepID=UPI000929F49A|nr:hypothetical protein [Singulisphaera sp. GP187]SIO58418.1 hypothetical protein SAMN05444166_5672 [Singulisphaera sp. GP187]
MAVRCFCDRCDAPINGDPVGTAIHDVIDIGADKTFLKLHFCHSCNLALKSWLATPPAKPSRYQAAQSFTTEGPPDVGSTLGGETGGSEGPTACSATEGPASAHAYALLGGGYVPDGAN